MVRAKFRVTKVAKTVYGAAAGQMEVTLAPEYDTTIPEDARFSKATPSGTIQLFVDNPLASDYLELGKYFYIDFTEVPKVAGAGG